MIVEPVAFSDYQEGASLPPLEHDPITRVQLVRYAGASGDFNPIHTVEEYARQVGLDGVIAHGMLSMGFLGAYAQGLAGRRGRVGRLKVRFQEKVRPGDVLVSRGTVEAVDPEERTVSLSVRAKRRADGEPVTGGEARLEYFADDRS